MADGNEWVLRLKSFQAYRSISTKEDELCTASGKQLGSWGESGGQWHMGFENRVPQIQWLVISFSIKIAFLGVYTPFKDWKRSTDPTLNQAHELLL
jgi:hypothetical protein